MAKNTVKSTKINVLSVQDRLLALCQQQQQRADGIHPHYGHLWQAICQQVNTPGKQLRPAIVLLAYQAYGGTDVDAACDVAVAWELLHIGLLLHDDVIDRDYSRHGQPNVAGQYLKIYDVIDDEARRSHLAQSASLLAGDLLLATARQQLADVALTNIFDNALFEVIGGELMDMETSLPDSTISPEAIAASKTASYTFIGPLLSGATMAGADVKQLQLLGELGRVLGLGFQLADDLLVFSDDSSTGKSNDSDLVEGKRTAVISMALTLLSPQDRTRALELLNSPSPEPDELRRLITSTNVQSVLADRLEGYGQQARAIVEQLKIMPEYKLQFEALIGKLFDGQT